MTRRRSRRDGAAAPRVAYLMSRFPKLSETFVLCEMMELESLGAAVEVFPLLRARQPVRHPEAARFVARAHFHPLLSRRIVEAQLHFLRRRPAVYLRALLEALRGNWRSPRLLLGALVFLPKTVLFAREMLRLGVSHVHAHFATHPALAALVVHRLTDIPFSFTAHGSDLHVDRTMLREKIEASAFTATVSHFNRRILLQACGPHVSEKVHVVRCGVDTSLFSGMRERALRGPFRVVCVASFEEVKGHAVLLDACRLLRDRGVAFECELIGDGPLRSDVEKRILRAGLEGHVRILGGRPRHEVARRLAQADAAALTSVPTASGKKEGIPVALIEAMASRLPVVASDLSGIPELVEPGRTGLLVPPGDGAAVARALERLSARPDLRRRLGEAARRKVLTEHDLEAGARHLLRLIEGEARAEEVPAFAKADAGRRAG